LLNEQKQNCYTPNGKSKMLSRDSILLFQFGV
jgi:hypothetical protein